MSAPPLGTATVRHVEVLLLQPQVVMVVVITSTGGVTKRVYRFAEPVDPGLANWARAVPERPGRAASSSGVSCCGAGSTSPRWAAASAAFLAVLRPPSTRRWRRRSSASTSAAPPACSKTCAARSSSAYQRLLEVLEQRAALLDVLSRSLDPRRPFVRVGPELDHPDAPQPLARRARRTGWRTARSARSRLLGPVRMDYDKAIRSVRAAAHELSRFVEEIYDDN